MNDSCEKCGGVCCSFKDINISWTSLADDETIEDILESHQIIEELLFQDGEVPDMEWYLDGRSIRFHCNHREDGKCTEYERRPNLCRVFECPILKGEMTVQDFHQVYGAEEDIDESEWIDITDRVKEKLSEVKNDE